MTQKMKWIYLATGGVLALTILFGAAFVFIQAGDASRATDEGSNLGSLDSSLIARAFGRGQLEWLGSEGSPYGRYMEALAEALGITVDELQTALEQARAAAIQQAVDEGLITQEQADKMPSGDRFGFRGMHGFRGFGDDMNELLADALGISVAELEGAQEQARATVIAQAVEEGTITQQEADLIEARGAIQAYVEEAMMSAFEEALQKAVADGVITQAQADQLLANRGAGFRGPGGFFRGRGMHGGRGAFGFDHSP